MKLKSFQNALYRLTQRGVELVDPIHWRLSCKRCKTIWSPNIQAGGKLPKRYWQCPIGCNIGN